LPRKSLSLVVALAALALTYVAVSDARAETPSLPPKGQMLGPVEILIEDWESPDPLMPQMLTLLTVPLGQVVVITDISLRASGVILTSSFLQRSGQKVATLYGEGLGDGDLFSGIEFGPGDTIEIPIPADEHPFPTPVAPRIVFGALRGYVKRAVPDAGIAVRITN